MRSPFAISPIRPALPFAVVAIAAAASASAGFVACGGAEFALAPDGGEVADAGSGAVDAGAPFCPNDAYDFCADFDREALSAEWSNIANTGGAAGSENDDASVSAPSSYLAISPPLAGSDAGTAHSILTELALPKGATHIGFDLRIDELSFPIASDATAAIFAIAYTQGPSYELALEFHPVAGNAAPFAAGLLEVTTIAGTTPAEKLTDLPGVLSTVGVWYRVQIDFTIDAATNPAAVPASVAVTSGSPPTTVTKLVTLTPPLGTALGARALDVGIEAFAATGETKLRFDNVTYSH